MSTAANLQGTFIYMVCPGWCLCQAPGLLVQVALLASEKTAAHLLQLL